MANFRNLLAWQKSYTLSIQVDRLSERIRRKRPRLADQMERAAESIPAAVAEGRGRRTDRDFAHFCTIGIASSSELENHLQRAVDLDLISRSEFESLSAAVIEVRKILVGLRKRLTGAGSPARPDQPSTTPAAKITL